MTEAQFERLLATLSRIEERLGQLNNRLAAKDDWASCADDMDRITR